MPTHKTAIIVALASLAAAPALADQPRILFEHGVGLQANVRQHAAAALPGWKFSYRYQGKVYTETFLGAEPKQGRSITVPVFLIPVRLELGGMVADPLDTLRDGRTIVQNTVDSPIFQSRRFFQNTTLIGDTQYEDAVQRANFWGIGGAATGYHLLLGTPKIETEVTFRVPANEGRIATEDGVRVILASDTWYKTQVEPVITRLHLPANSLPIFETTQTYLLKGSGNAGSCCVGGFHNYPASGVAYVQFTYIRNIGKTLVQAQDVAALSHEVGEWMEDPYLTNPSPCGGNYEVGDPIEKTANHGDFPYKLNRFVYHLQDLANPVYFGAPASTIGALAGETFRGTTLTVCQNGP